MASRKRKGKEPDWQVDFMITGEIPETVSKLTAWKWRFNHLGITEKFWRQVRERVLRKYPDCWAACRFEPDGEQAQKRTMPQMGRQFSNGIKQ